MWENKKGRQPEGAWGYLREIIRNFRFREKRLFYTFAPLQDSIGKDQGHHKPTVCIYVNVKVCCFPSRNSHCSACLGKPRTGCFFTPYMNPWEDHKCTPSLDAPVPTIELILSKTTGLRNFEKEIFYHKKEGGSQWGKQQVKITQLYTLGYEKVIQFSSGTKATYQGRIMLCD